MKPKPTFSGGLNIAMKVPPHQYEATLRFYRDILALPPIEDGHPSPSFAFGGNRLWIDKVPTLSQAEVWLEVVTDNLSAASDTLEAANVVRCDDIEELPDGLQAFWISNPAAIVHLVCHESESA